MTIDRPPIQHERQEEETLKGPDGELLKCEVWEPNEDRVFMEHSDGTTYVRLEKIELEQGGAIYIDHRYTKITESKIYLKPFYWLMDILYEYKKLKSDY